MKPNINQRTNKNRQENNNSGSRYSHSFDRHNYKKKISGNQKKEVREFVLTYLTEKEHCVTIEQIAKKFNILHKHIHHIFQQFQQEGLIGIWRENYDYMSVEQHNRPIFGKSHSKHTNKFYIKLK